MKSFGTTPLAPHCQKSCHHEGYNEQKHHSHHDGNQIFSTETFFHHVLKDTYKIGLRICDSGRNRGVFTQASLSFWPENPDGGVTEKFLWIKNASQLFQLSPLKSSLGRKIRPGKFCRFARSHFFSWERPLIRGTVSVPCLPKWLPVPGRSRKGKMDDCWLFPKTIRA